jgi:PAS domain S-box-containing protein
MSPEIPSSKTLTRRRMVDGSSERKRHDALEEVLERYAEGLTVLYELSSVFLTRGALEEALTTALSLIADHYGADLTEVLVPGEDGASLVFLAGTGWEDRAAGSVSRARTDDPAGFALLQGCPAIVSDFSGESAFLPSPLYERHGVSSGISVPMAAGERVAGVLTILYRQPRHIETAELWYLNAVANAVAVFIKKETARRRFEESELFLSSVLEAIGDGVVVVDREMRILSANSGYLSSAQIDIPEVRGRRCYEVSRLSAVPCYERGESCIVREVFDAGKPRSALQTRTDRAGRPVHLQVHAYPVTDATGAVVATVQTIMDVTEKVHLEKDLDKRVRELEEFYDMAVGRELRMIELKEEVERLQGELARYRET